MAVDIKNIQIGVNLIDDYLLVQEAPVANGLTRQLFAVVQNPLSKDPASELLTLDGDGDPVHFYPDSTSQSGWSTTKLGAKLPTNAKTWNRIVAFYHQGVLNALCYYPLGSGDDGSAVVWMQSSTPGTWTNATLSPEATNFLGDTYQTDQYVDSEGNAYLYGFTGNMSPPTFFIMAFVPGTANGQPTTWWDPFVQMWPEQFSPEITDVTKASFLLAPGPDGAGSITLVWVDDNKIAYQNGTISWSEKDGSKQPSFALTGSSTTYDPSVGTLTADNLYAIPGDLGSGNLLVLDSASTLYWLTGLHAGQPSMTPLSGGTSQPGSTSAIGVGVDSSGIITIFAIEPSSSNLWYLQQTDGSPLTFGNWVQLGGTLYSLNCPTYMRAGPELFSAGLGTDPASGSTGPAVFHTGQNLSDAGDGTYIWATHKVSAPPATSSTAPVRTATYSMEVQALDGAQNAVGNTTVTATADQPVTVVWNGYAFHIGPNTPLEVELDASGQANVLFEGVELKPAVITFTAYDTNNNVTASRWSRGDIVQFIPDIDGTPLTPLPNSVAPQLGSATGTDLINNGLTGGDYANTGPADTAAQAINACGQYIVPPPNDQSNQGTIDTSKLRIQHWQIDFTHAGGPRFRVLTQDEASTFLAGLPRRDDVAALGSLGSIFGDVAHYFKHEFDKLEKFTATLENDALTIVFNDLAPFVISTIKQAGAGLETIFAKIKQIADDIYNVIKDVIEWLKMLFDWDDILNTHKAIKAAFTATLDNMKTAVANAETDLAKWFSSLNTDITDTFDNLENYFDSSTSFNAMANQAQTSAPALLANGSNALAATNTRNTQQQHASKCSYIYSRSKPSFGNIGATAAAALGTPTANSDPTQTIIDAINNNILKDNTFDQQSQAFLDEIYASVSDPSEFFDMIILVFLQAAKDITLFIVDVIEAVLEAILALLEQAITQIKTTITAQSPNIPVVSWLWENVISDSPLTILDLFCLIMAVPTTVLYKIIYGGKSASPPFTSSMVSELETNGLPWPTLPSVSDTGVSWSTSVGYTPPSAGTLEALGITAGLTYFLSGFFAADTDFYAASGEADKATALSIASIVLTGYQDGATAPYAVFAKPYQNWTDADTWTINCWWSGLFQLSCDTAFVALSANHTLLKFVSAAGPAGDTAMGICQEAVGAVACYYQRESSDYTGWDASSSVIAPIDQCLRFLIDCGDDAVLFLQGVDVVVGCGTMVTVCGAAKNG